MMIRCLLAAFVLVAAPARADVCADICAATTFGCDASVTDAGVRAMCDLNRARCTGECRAMLGGGLAPPDPRNPGALGGGAGAGLAPMTGALMERYARDGCAQGCGLNPLRSPADCAALCAAPDAEAAQAQAQAERGCVMGCAEPDAGCAARCLGPLPAAAGAALPAVRAPGGGLSDLVPRAGAGGLGALVPAPGAADAPAAGAACEAACQDRCARAIRCTLDCTRGCAP
jgi:hypothetical protein